MGADFMLWGVPLQYSKDQAIANLDDLIRCDYGRVVETAESQLGYDADEHDLRELMVEQIELVYDYAEHASRMCAVWWVAGTKWVFAGGITHGDMPTDQCLPLAAVSDLCLTCDEKLWFGPDGRLAEAVKFSNELRSDLDAIEINGRD